MYKKHRIKVLFVSVILFTKFSGYKIQPLKNNKVTVKYLYLAKHYFETKVILTALHLAFFLPYDLSISELPFLFLYFNRTQ